MVGKPKWGAYQSRKTTSWNVASNWTNMVAAIGLKRDLRQNLGMVLKELEALEKETRTLW